MSLAKYRPPKAQYPQLARWTVLEQYQAQPWIEATGVGVINPPANPADFNRFYNEYLIKAALGQTPLDDAAWAEYLTGLDGLGAKDWEAQALKTLMDSGFIK